jgi:DNA (cytosine-5)-methyltransferase 1
MSRAYYNEIDPAAAHVLRALIADGVIAPGDVDDRSIKDVQPDDVRGYAQCHFFAGGGLWSVAARLAGWPDDRPLWTGSCPCQPFSVAGKGAGKDDPRHLWPDFFRLIRAARPAVVVGEQVAGAAGYGWFDGVAADLEGENYAGRAVDVPACAVDAPHIRQRLYWAAIDLANAYQSCSRQGRQQRGGELMRAGGDPQTRAGNEPLDNEPLDLADAESPVGRPEPKRRPHDDYRANAGRQEAAGRCGMDREAHRGVALGDADGSGRGEHGGAIAVPSQFASAERAGGHAFLGSSPRTMEHAARERRGEGRPEHELRSGRSALAGASRRNGSFWSDHEWRIGADGKARRAKPDLRLLVDGLPGRVGMLRIAGNAIVPVLAAEVLAALIESIGQQVEAA